MCGINVVVNYGSDEYIGSMNSTLCHRGPDQLGTFSDDPVTMSLSRLSILDPTEAGKQPMTHDNLIISYNGEVYNYRELRSDLQRDGYEFSSQTDTEVILKGFSRDGEDFLTRLNGIVAVVIYDRSKDVLKLFRDQLGIKPLYYTVSDDGFFVSSEIKAILEGTDVDLTQDGLAIHEYLSTKNISAESMFEEVDAVPPGAVATFSVGDRTMEIRRLVDVYEEIDQSTYSRFDSADESALIDELDDRLNRVVKRQLVSDVPLATICSGGVDSSLVTAIASQYHDDITVYHVSVDDERYNEREYAEQVADYLDLDIRIRELDQSAFVSRIDSCIYHNDVPLIHPNSVGVSAVNELAHEDGYKVLLTGEGADEVFGGYSRYRYFYYFLMLNQTNVFRQLLGSLVNPEYLMQSFASSGDSFVERFLRDQTALDLEQPSLSGKSLPQYRDIEERYDHIDSTKRRKSLSYMAYDLRHHLVPLLRRADRMSMMWNIEARVPFLDDEVLQFGLNLPHEYKIRRGSRKYLLKKVAERYLPDEVVHRSKLGFPLPIDQWLEESGRTVDRGVRSTFYDEWRSQYLSDGE